MVALINLPRAAWKRQPQGSLLVAPYWINRQVTTVTPCGGLMRCSHGEYGVPSGSDIAIRPTENGYASTISALTTQSIRIYSSSTLHPVWSGPKAQVTVFALVKKQGNTGGNAPIFGYLAPSTHPYYFWGLTDALGTGTIQFLFSTGYYQEIGSAGSLITGKLQFILGVYDGINAYLYVDGVLVASSAISGNLSYLDADYFGVAVGNFYNYTTTARSFNGEIYLCGISPIAFSAYEIKALSKNPWQLFNPATPRFYLIPSGASSYQLVSSFASASSSSTAALNIQRILASTCASLSSTASISLISLIPLLSALTSASETATSAWQVLRVLQSTLASDSSTSPAALAIERALLSALTSASLSTTSALNVQRNFLTALSSDSSAPAITLSIAGLLALLSALSSQSSTAASALDVQRALLSALTSQSATGDITLNTETLIALLSAVASTSLSSASALNITRSLATAINSPSSTATAALPVQRPLTTGLNAQSNTSISVLELINLIGLASTVSSQSSTSTAIANLARALVSELLSASSTATIPLPVLRDLAVTLVSASLTDAIDLSLTMLGQIDLVSLIQSSSLTNPQVRLLADLVAAIQTEMKVQMTGISPSMTLISSGPSIALHRT